MDEPLDRRWGPVGCDLPQSQSHQGRWLNCHYENYRGMWGNQRREGREQRIGRRNRDVYWVRGDKRARGKNRVAEEFSVERVVEDSTKTTCIPTTKHTLLLGGPSRSYSGPHSQWVSMLTWENACIKLMLNRDSRPRSMNPEMDLALPRFFPPRMGSLWISALCKVRVQAWTYLDLKGVGDQPQLIWILYI